MSEDIEKAKQGDNDAFERLITPYQKELFIHCYKMTGSVVEAEDMVQETLLRAWKRFSTYQETGAFRAWLYRIATNICLDHLRKRKSRSLMLASVPNHQAGPPTLGPIIEELWLEPLPSAFLPSENTNPEATFSLNESVNLAFLTALHKLSPRNRAILLLRDVLGWRTKEVATFFELSDQAVNSVLKRARHEISVPHGKNRNKATPELIQQFQQRYMSAWQNNDVAQLVAILKEDVVLNMPPLPCWYGGREAVLQFFKMMPLDGQNQGRWRCLPLEVNGQTAVALYESLTGETPYLLNSINVLDCAQTGIFRIDNFLIDKAQTLPNIISAPWLKSFNLPESL
ncbi:MAG: RNA polymerase subunit sigma-70 [Chloroflexota bacterium]